MDAACGTAGASPLAPLTLCEGGNLRNEGVMTEGDSSLYSE